MSGPVKKLAGEAAKKGGLLNTLMKAAPWKITGPASGAEWKEVPIGAEEYRVVAPASQPATVRIPHSEPERVFDVRYYERDTRRAHEVALHGSPKTTTTEITRENFDAHLRAFEESGQLKAFAEGKGNRVGFQDPGAEGSEYVKVSMLDNTNGGYT